MGDLQAGRTVHRPVDPRHLVESDRLDANIYNTKSKCMKLKALMTRTGISIHLDVHVGWRNVDKGGEALAEPHGDVPVHVDGEGFKAFLQAIHCVVLKGTGILAQVHATDLGQTQTAHRDETWRK